MEENLLYVAVTRAKLVLEINDSVAEAIAFMEVSKIQRADMIVGALVGDCPGY